MAVEARKRDGRSVLVVDDEARNVELVVRVLRREYRVVTATSGEEGLARIREQPGIFLTISDQRMPGMTGAHFLTAAREIAPDALRVLMTGYAELDAVVDAVNRGAIFRYLRKPVSPGDLVELAKSSWQMYDLQGRNRRLVRELELANEKLREQKRLLELTLDQRTRELVEANARLEQLAVRDGLTGLHNHRYFRERLQEETQRATRYGTALSLAIIDLDHFKSYNDRYGHPQGDALLREVANVLGGSLRSSDVAGRAAARSEGEGDVVARYGGEEFVVLLPHTRKPAARQVAERIRRLIEEHSGGEAPVTASIGVAELPADAGDADALLQAADDALYRAKAAGRNRVVAASD